MTRAQRWTIGLAAVGVIGSLVGSVPAVASAGGAETTPGMGRGAPELRAVSATSATDVWAVGIVTLPGVAPLIEHWDGSAWTEFPSPNLNGQAQLNGVSAVSAADAWAVGYAAGTPYQPMIQHWDGTSWTVVPIPDQGETLEAVSAVSSSDVWAVGTGGDTNANTLVEHWDGTSWTIVASPSPVGYDSSLSAVDVVSADDVWAVGTIGTYTNDGYRSQGLVEHWDGSSWTVVPSPNPIGSIATNFAGVAAVSDNDVWAVGTTYDGVLAKAVIEHWDGTTWSTVAKPTPEGTSVLRGISARSRSNVWTVGYYDTLAGPGQVIFAMLIEHWDGTSWSRVPIREPKGSVSSFLFGVGGTVSRSHAWAVGSYQPVNRQRILIEHWNGTRWSRW